MGYSPDFVRKMKRLQDGYLSGESVLVVDAPDDACISCPHLNIDVCQMPEGLDPQRLDGITKQSLRFEAGETITVADVVQALNELDSEQWQALCQGCTWRENAGCIDLLKRYAGDRPTKSR